MSLTPVRLSDRLEAIIRLCPECECLYDIGCDHGYISIASVMRHIAKRAIACDINEGPIERALEHIKSEGLEELIETRISDGLSAVDPKENDVVVIAGMGGPLIDRILADDSDKAKRAGMLVLGPQSEVGSLRRSLCEKGYMIVDEDMIEEDGKFYPLMAVRFDETVQTPPVYSKKECEYGPLLIQKKHPVLNRYLIRLRQVLERNINSIEKADADPNRAADIRTQAEMIDSLIKEMS